MEISLNFDRIINAGITGTFTAILEKPMVLSDRIVPANTPENAAIANGTGTIDLKPSQAAGVAYIGFLLVGGQRRWTGRFFVPETGSNLNLAALLELTPPDNDWQATAQSIVDRLIVDPDFLVLLAGLGGGGGGGSELPSLVAPITQSSLSVASIAIITHNFGRLPTTVSVTRNGAIVFPDQIVNTATATAIDLKSFVPLVGNWIATLEA